MTDQDKLNHYETLQTLRQRIGACFGSVDLLFAEHPSDEQEAEELLELAFENNISLDEVVELTFTFLFKQNDIDPTFLKEQLIGVSDFFSTKLK